MVTIGNLLSRWCCKLESNTTDYTELKKVRTNETNSTYLKVAVMIDEIGEFEGDHRDMSLFLRSLVSQRVKFMALSR